MHITITFKANRGKYERVKSYQVEADTPEEASEAITVLITSIYAEMGKQVEVSCQQSRDNLHCEPDKMKERFADRTFIRE